MSSAYLEGLLRSLSHLGSLSYLWPATLQAMSTMIRVGISPLVLLINNSGYVIEEEIHSGPYNKISDWNYTAVVEGMAGTCKNLFTAKVLIFPLSSPVCDRSDLAHPSCPCQPPPLPALASASPCSEFAISAILRLVRLLLCCIASITACLCNIRMAMTDQSPYTGQAHPM